MTGACGPALAAPLPPPALRPPGYRYLPDPG